MKVAFPGGLTYAASQIQSFTITISDATAATYGFEMTARMDDSPNTLPAGKFTAGPNQRLICSNSAAEPSTGCPGNGIEWIEHSQPSLNNTFVVQWTAPATATGNVHIYVAANATNGDNTSRGDHIYFSDYVITPASTSGTVPAITGAVNGASGTGAIQAGSWATVSGSNFATTATTWDNAIISGVFPTTLGGVTVAIDGRPAPISFASPAQLRVLVPLGSASGDVSVVVSNANGSSAPFKAQLAAVAPGFFTFTQSQKVYVSAIIMDSPSGFSYLAPPGSLGNGVQARAAKPGDVVVLYGTGFGPTTTALNPEFAQNVAYPVAHTGADITAPTCTLTIGGQAAQVLFAGLVSPGLYQINAVVPQVTSGDQLVAMKLLSGPSTTQQVFIPAQ